MIRKIIFYMGLMMISCLAYPQAPVHHLPMKALTMDKNIVYTTISVTLNKEATVNVYRDKHLIYSQNFKAGHHVINPTIMPLGTYQVKVDIVQEGQVIRSFKQYYLKEIPQPHRMQHLLNVQLLEPAAVTVLKNDKRLYHFQFMSAGFYKIDTTKFPVGIYPVTIKVKGDGGKYQYHQVVIFHKIEKK